MKFVYIDSEGDAILLKEEPTVDEVENGGTFLKLMVASNGEIVISTGTILEADGEEEENEVEWSVL